MYRLLSYIRAKKFFQTRKTTTIRRIADRETSISRHHRGPIEGPPEILQTITAAWYWGVLNWALTCTSWCNMYIRYITALWYWTTESRLIHRKYSRYFRIECRVINFHSNWTECYRGDNFPFDFEQNRIWISN